MVTDERRTEKAVAPRVSGDTDVIGFVEAIMPEQLDLMVAAVMRTSQGRAAVLKAAYELSGMELQDVDFSVSAATEGAAEAVPAPDDIDTSELMERAGDMLSSAQVANLLGQTRQSVNDMVNGGRVLGVRFGTRWRFPQVQFRQHEVVPGMAMILAAMGELNSWRKLQILLAPSPDQGPCPLELMLCGDKTRAMAIASRAAAEVRLSSGIVSRSTTLSKDMDDDLEADLQRDLETARVPRLASSS